jgi:hypothetical protein
MAWVVFIGGIARIRFTDEEGARAYIRCHPPELQKDMVLEYHRMWPPAGYQYGKPMEHGSSRRAAPKACRYLEALHRGDRVTPWCAYMDQELRGDEDIWCYPGGCHFYEAPGPPRAVVYEDGRWMTPDEYGEWLRTNPSIPEGYEVQNWKTELANVNSREE